MISQEEVLKQAEQVRKSVICHRRQIHQYAEIGGKEYKTHQYMKILIICVDQGVAYRSRKTPVMHVGMMHMLLC